MLSYFVSSHVDGGAAQLAGEWMQRFESRGLGWMEALIVASGVRARLAVLTRDAKLGQLLADEARFEIYAGA